MSATTFNFSETIVLLAQVFSHLVAENDHSQVHVVNGGVPSLMLLTPLNGMHFNVLDILSGRQSLLST